MPYKPSPLQCTHYKPLGQQIPVTRKAHETVVSPHRKFQSVSRAVGGATSFLSSVGRESVSNSSFAGVTARDFQVARYRRPKQRVLKSKPFLATTTTKTDYQMDSGGVLKAYEKPRKMPLSEMAVASKPRTTGREYGKSSYQLDMGAEGDDPASRTVSSTTDLNKGTSKLSVHIPGYCGHVPCSKKNQNMYETFRGQQRPEKSDIRGTSHVNMPNYTGHQPQYGEMAGRPCYCGAATSTGNSNLEGLGLSP